MSVFGSRMYPWRPMSHLPIKGLHTGGCCCGKTRNLKGKSVTSQKWLVRQMKDPFVKKAQQSHYRCRSAYKLLELDARFSVLRPGAVVVDCGAAPGSWTQVAVDATGSAQQGEGAGLVVGVDLLTFAPVPGALLIPQADFTLPATRQRIKDALSGRPVDVVLSDMAPNATGVKSLDQELIIRLAMSCAEFGAEVLRPGGALVCKLWQGGELGQFKKTMQTLFADVRVAKPEASRDDSAEIYVISRGFGQKAEE